MGQAISSLCGNKDNEEQLKTISPKKEPVSANQPKVVSPTKEIQPTQPVEQFKKLEEVKSKPESQPKQTSESGSSSHITINDFTWLKVALILLVSGKRHFRKSGLGHQERQSESLRHEDSKEEGF